MSLLLLLRNRPAPKSMVTKDYDIWDQESIDADVGPQQQKTVEATLQNQLGFLMRKTWRTPSPVGCIMQYVGNNAPIGWLFCDGGAYSRTEYSDLWTIIQDTYGAGDGSTTFNVPNFAGRVPVGEGTGAGLTARTLGQTGGAETHTLTVNEMPSHTHTIQNFKYGLQGVDGGGASASDETETLKTSDATGGDQPHNNMQPYVVVRYIIRY